MKKYLLIINLLLGIFDIKKPKIKKKFLIQIKKLFFGK